MRFLGVDVPDMEFPHENQTEAFRKGEGVFRVEIEAGEEVFEGCGCAGRVWCLATSLGEWVRRWVALIVGKHGGM